MKICLFVDSFLPEIGGLQYAVHYLGNALVENGCDVTVIAKISKNKNLPCLPEHKYNLIRYGYTFPGSGRAGLDNSSAIKALLKQHYKIKFDIINCHNVSYAATRVRYANKFLKLPVVLTPHGDDVETVPEINYGLRLNKRWDRIIKKNLRSADAITTINAKIKSEINFISQDKLYSIPNGINVRYFSSRKSDFLYNKFSISHEKKIVISVGRYDTVKGYECGISAFNELFLQNPSINLVYIIVGKDTNVLNSLIKKYSLEKKIFTLENQNQENLAKCYNSSWCFFSPSIMEGLSLVSLEAMACGLPLVVTDVPGNNDIINQNNCGILVKNQEISSMVSGIISLINNPKIYAQYSKNALENVGKYDWIKIAQMYIDVYQKVISLWK